MFRAELADTDLLKNSLQSISNVITEGVFQFTEDGVELVAADPAMVAMVDFRMDEEAFDVYECDSAEQVGINIENLYSIIRRTGSDDTLSLSLNDDESKLQITMENHSTRNFSLALLNLDDSDIPSTSDLDFNVQAALKTSMFSDAIGDAAVVGDSVTISAEDNTLVVQSAGDNSNVEFRIDEGSDGLIDLDMEGPLDYLSKMIKAKKLSNTVNISLGADFPMRMEFQAPENVELGFILAPRIEED
jgi:proliferating cell nuclear antigen